MKLNIQKFADGWYPFNPLLGQVIQSEVNSVNPDRAFLAHLGWTGAQAGTASADAVIAAFATASGAATIVSTGFTAPPAVRNITLTVGGTATDIAAVQGIVRGTDYNDEVIEETMPAFTVDTAGTVVG